MQQVKLALREYIISDFLFGDAERMPADSESLLETGVIDSTGVLELIEFLSEEFGIEVTEEETVPANLGTLDNVTAFVLRRRSEAA